MISGASVFDGQTEELKMSKSSTTTRKRRSPEYIHNPHAGEILLEEFLKPLGLSQNALARAIKVPPRRINEIVLGKRAVSADTDLRLARYFGVSEGMFLGLQADFDLMEQRRKLGRRLEEIQPRAA
jgi:addiction module HigA family antidote